MNESHGAMLTNRLAFRLFQFNNVVGIEGGLYHSPPEGSQKPATLFLNTSYGFGNKWQDLAIRAKPGKVNS